MSFQWVIDNAASISVTTQPTVAQSFTRSNRPKAVSRGGDSYRWTVQMPAGMRYTDARPYIAAYEAVGRDNIVFLNIPQPYISGYTGTGSVTTGWQVTFALASNIATLVSTGSGQSFPTPTSKFLSAGDLIQPIDPVLIGRVYTVVEDAYLNAGAAADPIYLHRPANEPGQHEVNLGSACEFRMLATKIPQWEIFDYDLVRWSGQFEFYEVLGSWP
jgi:hypothetical protein